MLRFRFGKRFGKRGRGAAQQRARPAPTVEALEERRLMSTAPPATLLVPAYFYPTPGGDWGRMSAAARSVPVTAILNPDSGPGKKADPTYVAAVNDLHSNGGRVVGYVHTSYGRRTLAAVKNEMIRYKKFYHLDGFFIDEMATDPHHVVYYHALYNYVRLLSRGPYQVIGNPGTNTQERYLTAPAADVLVDFENDQGDYPGFSPSPWVGSYGSQHFGNIVGQAANDQVMSNDLLLARQRNAGYVYVTDQDIADYSNSYNRLPTFWDQEVATVRAEDGL